MPDAPPTAFISYAWESESHKQWVAKFATDLRKNDVDAILDQWHLRVADDVAQFMEQSVARADYVLLICTEQLAKKANLRMGGHGYEYSVIAGLVLTEVPQRGRLLPILRSGSPSTSLPLYLRSRLFVDLRSEAEYELGLAQVLRHIFGAYETVVPPIGARSFSTSVRTQAARPPKRWVLVAGTGIPASVTDIQAGTADRLGKLLADSGFGLVTGGWPGVDEIVARAFSDRLLEGDVPLEDYLVQIVRDDVVPAYAAGNLVLVPRGEREWTESVDRADVVVLIGGLGGTWSTGEMALARGKIVLPLADTKGDAGQFYFHMVRTWPQCQLSGISLKDFHKVARAAPRVVDDLVSLLS